VGHVGQGPELLLEAVQRRGIDPPQGLEGHDFPALAVPGLVDDPHAAAADLAQKVIAGP
jgi:hypothetical protein